MSAEKQNDSVTHTHIQSCKNTLLHYGLSQEIGFSSLCYTVRPCLTILNVIVCFYLSACVLSQVPLFANSMGCNLPGSSVHGIFQARILEGIIIFSSRGSSQLRDGTQVLVSSAMAGRFFTTWEAHPRLLVNLYPPPLPLGNHESVHQV